VSCATIGEDSCPPEAPTETVNATCSRETVCLLIWVCSL
jgi:hypothetical protein